MDPWVGAMRPDHGWRAEYLRIVMTSLADTEARTSDGGIVRFVTTKPWSVVRLSWADCGTSI